MIARAAWTRMLAKAGQSAGTLVTVIVLVFLLVRLIPGDPVTTILGSDTSPAAVAALRAELRLDEPLTSQFADYVSGLARGDLGTSAVQRGEPVAALVFDALPTTLAVVVVGMLLGVIGGITLGLWAALTSRPGIDLSLRSLLMLSYATPTFLIALLLILFFSIYAGWLPAGGWPGKYPANLLYLVLPGIALASHLVPVIARAVRQAAIGAQQQLYMEAALSRGLTPRTLNLHHILPNSLLPVITLLGISFGGLLTGAIIVETVFGLPGLGSEMSKAVLRRDYPVVQGIALVSAFAVILGNLLAELAYTLVDPRARHS